MSLRNEWLTGQSETTGRRWFKQNGDNFLCARTEADRKLQVILLNLVTRARRARKVEEEALMRESRNDVLRGCEITGMPPDPTESWERYGYSCQLQVVYTVRIQNGNTRINGMVHGMEWVPLAKYVPCTITQPSFKIPQCKCHKKIEMKKIRKKEQ